MLLLELDLGEKYPEYARAEFQDCGVANQTNSALYPLTPVRHNPGHGQYTFHQGFYRIAAKRGDHFQVTTRVPGCSPFVTQVWAN